MSRPPDPTAKISLLRASEQVFAEKGLERAKVEDITKLAGLSKGAFYLHFESKEEAFKQVVESFLARCEANLPQPTALPSPDGPADVLALWLEVDTQMYEFLWQNRAIVAILQGCQGPHVYLLEAFNDSIQVRGQEWLDFWKKRGFVRRDLDTTLASTLLNGAHHQLSMQLLASAKKPPIVEWLAKTQAIFVRGFCTPPMIEALSTVDKPPVSQRITRLNETKGHERSGHEKNGNGHTKALHESALTERVTVGRGSRPANKVTKRARVS